MTYAVTYKCKTERANHHGGDTNLMGFPRLEKSGFSYGARSHSPSLLFTVLYTMLTQWQYYFYTAVDIVYKTENGRIKSHFGASSSGITRSYR